MPHQNGKSITKTRKRVLLITTDWRDIKKIKKNAIHISRLRTGQYMLLFHTCYVLFKNFNDLSKVVEIKVDFALAKKTQNAKHLKMKYQQRSVKPNHLLLK